MFNCCERLFGPGLHAYMTIKRGITFVSREGIEGVEWYCMQLHIQYEKHVTF